MSLINDALIKAERDRAEEASARASLFRPHERAALRHQAKKTRSLGFAVANTAALVAIFGAVIAVLVRNRQPPSPAPNPTVAAAETSAASPARNEALPPPPPAALGPETEPIALPKPPPAPYELAGMSALGKDTLLSILRRSDRRSLWVPVGKTVGEITAVSYDPQTDKAVIRVDDELFTLPLRTGSADEPPVQAAE